MEDIKKKILLILKKSTNPHDELILIHPYDFASVLGELAVEERKQIFTILEKQYIADIFEYIEDKEAVLGYFEEMPKAKSALILDEMERDEATDVIKEDSDLSSKYLNLLNPESKEEITYLLGHEEDTAGSIMTTNFIAVKDTMNVKEAMKVLIREANETEIIDSIFVLDDLDELKGVISLKNLIIARAPQMISDIMDKNVISSDVGDDIVSASKKIHDYGIYALPVLDSNKLKGIITMDDALDTLEDEGISDYEHLAGVGDIDEYLSFFANFRKRFPWLILLLGLSFIVSLVMSGFDEIIKTVTTLVFFETLILDMGGNSGTQALAVTVRGIAKKEFDTPKNIFRNLFKEIKIGFFNGFLLSILAFGTSFLFLFLRGSGNDALRISLIVGVSLGISLLTSGIIGTLIPIILYKIKIDPAVASGPFITTVSDILSILIYFSLATEFILNL